MTRIDFREGNSWLWMQPDAFTAQADAWLAAIDRQTPWRQDTIHLYGKTVAIPRQQAWIGDAGCDYRYSGLTLHPQPWTPLLQEIAAIVGKACDAAFNAVLLNRYASGLQSMGWHSDDEPELGRNPLLAILSLGATRELAIRSRHDKRRSLVGMPHGSLLVMGGAFQHEWQHALPVRRRIHELRISLTFRHIHPVGI